MFNKNKSFTTERLELCLLNQNHSEFVSKIVNTEGWLKFIGDRKVYSLSDASIYIDKLLNTKNLFYWIIKIKKDDTPIGIISFIKRDYLEHFDIGFALLPEFHGKGYAYEGASVILSFAKNVLLHKTILATTYPDNTHSIKVLAKLNFTFLKEILHNNHKLHVFTH